MSFFGGGAGGGGTPDGNGGLGTASPGSSTDNAIIRWDGVLGAAIQNSTVTLADTSGAMNFNAGSGANITWTTDAAGDIGANGANRPGNIFVKTSLKVQAGNAEAEKFKANAGTTAAPAFMFASDTGTGMSAPGGTQLSFSQGGTERLNINNTGKINIPATTGAKFQAGTTALNDWFAENSVFAVSPTQQAFMATRTGFDTIIGISNSQGLTAGYGMVHTFSMPEAERNLYLEFYEADTATAGKTFRVNNAGVISFYNNVLFNVDNTKDIGASLANRPANVHIAAQLLSGSGNAALPGLSFDADPDTGITSDGANQLIFSTGGSQRAALNSSGLNLSNITASRAVINNGSNILEESVTTAAELAFVNGVTSAIQTQLDAKVATSGRLKLNRTAVADADYTVLTSDYYVGLTSITVARVFTLPAAATAGTGSLIVIKDEGGTVTGTNTLTIDGNAAETIDGAANFVLGAAYDSVTLICNGTNWFVI